MNISVIVLAAGRSERFGSDKLMAQFDDGMTLIEKSLQIYLSLSLPVTVVVSPNSTVFQRLSSNTHVSTITCAQSIKGMGASIRCGIQSNLAHDAWLIALADMPLIKPSTVAALIEKITGGALLVVPEYRNVCGHPVGFGKSLQFELSTLAEETGAKSILEKYREIIDVVGVDDPGIHVDVDSKIDFDRLRSFHP